VTKTLKKWLEDDYLAGPFLSPPLSEFRANSMMAIQQGDKVRLVLNMSYPKENSFNDNVDEDKVGKVAMSSANNSAKLS